MSPAASMNTSAFAVQVVQAIAVKLSRLHSIYAHRVPVTMDSVCQINSQVVTLVSAMLVILGCL